MDEIFADFLITLVVFSSIFGIVYTFLITRYRERTLMIERGVNPQEFKSKSDGSWSALKAGLLLVGIALGLIIGGIFEGRLMMDESVFYIAMVTFCGGLGLLSYFFIKRKYGDKE